MAIQMRRGLLADYDKNKMLAGEWGIAIDATTENQKAYVAFAPGVDKEVLFVEDADTILTKHVKDATEEAEAWAHGDGYTANDYASGDGTTLSFALEEPPVSVLQVVVDGVELTTSDYSVSGKVITFNDAPAAGTNNVYVKYTVNTTNDNAKKWALQAAETGEYWEAKTAETGEHWANETQTRGLQMAQLAESWAIGERNGVPVPSTDQTYENNSRWYTRLSELAYHQCLITVQNVEAYFALIKQLLGTTYLNTENSDVLNTEDGDRIVIDY